MIDFFEQIWRASSPYLKDVIDIALVAYLVYHIYRLLSHTRAIPVIIGLVILMTISFGAQWLQLEAISVLFAPLPTYIIIAVIVILQPELRRMFYSLGQTRWSRAFFPVAQVPIEEILQGVLNLAEDRTGALVVLVKNVGLKQLTEGGISFRADISREVIQSVFYKGNPLHDGALIIQGNRIESVATYLPISSSPDLKKTHGARHRAGLGITEESDALSIVISEEKRGKISVCFLGQMQENIDSVALKSILNAFNSNRLEDEWAALFESKQAAKPRKAKKS